jgi:F-type H+-transporting ATPase subunit alpha
MTPKDTDLGGWAGRVRRRLDRLGPVIEPERRGVVGSLGDGVVRVNGLPRTRLDELLLFANGEYGMAVSLDVDEIGCVLLGTDAGIASGSEVRGTGEVARVPVGRDLLGRVIDPLARPLDGGPGIVADEFQPVEKPAPAIVDRDVVREPLYTGLTVIDAMLPLGRGQRELLIGDRGVGKTAVAVDAIVNQRRSDIICVYAAVGQKSSTVNAVIEAVRRHGAFDRCIFVVAAADAPIGLQWLCPYAACTMAEYFTERGGHALLVIDDLTQHAIIHRQVSLLLRYPPGREAYPGDVFYAHSRLLERAAKRAPELGGGSLSALPIAETQAGNLSAYIPTNLISITDGQIYLETALFHEGVKPAVNVGKSVSRVGGKTQAPALRELAERLRLDYAQFLELEVFTRFGAMIDERTSRIIEHGRRVRAVLRQSRLRPLSLTHQVALLLALQERLLDGVPEGSIDEFKRRLPAWLAERRPGLIERLNAKGVLEAEDRVILLAELEALAGLVAASPGGGAKASGAGEG